MASTAAKLQDRNDSKDFAKMLAESMGEKGKFEGNVVNGTIVDITDVPQPVQVGDSVVLVGRQGPAEISVTEFSTWGDTIAWETLCSVTKRVPRHYRNASGV